MNFLNKISVFFEGLYFQIFKKYDELWDMIMSLDFFLEYKDFPFRKMFNSLMLSFFVIVFLLLFFKDKKKRYLIATLMLSIIISVFSILGINNIYFYEIDLGVIDKLKGVLVFFLGLSVYSFSVSVIHLYNKNKDKNKVPAALFVFFYLFVVGYFHSYSDFFLKKENINIIRSIGLILISPLWIYYVPFSIVFYSVYIYILPSFLLVGKNKKTYIFNEQQNKTRKMGWKI